MSSFARFLFISQEVTIFEFMEPRDRIERLLARVRDNYAGLSGVDPSIDNRKSLVEELAAYDRGLSEQINELTNSLVALEFVKQDKELRMKMQDVWEDQVKQHREKLGRLLSDLEKSMGIADSNEG